MDGPDPIRVVVTDANVLINLIHVDALWMLGALPGYEFLVPVEVEAELTQDTQAAALRHAMQQGHVTPTAFAGTDELVVFADLVQVVGRGEAACLAMAEVNGFAVASDERRRFRRLVEERIGLDRLLTTPGVFVLAIRAGLLTVEQADEAKAELESRRFRMRFASFRDVLEPRQKG